MSNEFCNFINTQTGEVVYLPAHYADLFDTLVPTDQDVECTDCITPDPEEVALAEQPVEQSEDIPVTLAITEPARRSRRR